MNHSAKRPPSFRLLVVEDEAIVAMLLEDILVDLGCTVVGPVGSVAKALALLDNEAHRLDGAVLDVNLGTEQAYPVAEVLSARAIPFAFITGYGRAGVDARFETVPVFSKPIQATEIERFVERLQSQARE